MGKTIERKADGLVPDPMSSDISCRECKARLFPEDPSQSFFVPYDKRGQFRGLSADGFLPALCRDCGNNTGEQPGQSPQVIVTHVLHHHTESSEPKPKPAKKELKAIED